MGVIAFLPPAVVTIRKILVRKESNLSRNERGSKCNAYSLYMNAGSSKQLPDFDRDYFDELKAEYGHLPGVRIFGRDDYTLDANDVPWLFDDRARDVGKIREDIKHAPLEDGELKGLPTRPMRICDMLTKKEIDDFEDGFRWYDAVKGDVWDDPMPESDFEGDPNWIDLRKVDDSCMQEEPDVWRDSTKAPILKRQQYDSEEEEKDALLKSFERLQAERYETSFHPLSHGERNSVPDPADFAVWQQEAEARGGNATEYESYGLSPFNSWNFSDTSSSRTLEETEVPKQHQALINAHAGQWKGKISVISVCKGEAFSPHLVSSCNAWSEIIELSDGSLEWTTIADTDGIGEIVSSVMFSSRDCEDALVPGRAVSKDGSYVCKGYCDSYSKKTTSTISLSRVAAKRISRDESCHPVVEIGLVTKLGAVKCRHRVILCVNVGATEKNHNEAKAKIGTAITFTEFPTSTPLSATTNRHTKSSLPAGMVSELLGTWNGNGLLLQPEYPPTSCQAVETTFTMMAQKSINENDISFVENTIPEHPDLESKRRARTVGKKKTSKRVAASKAHDRRRLANCNLLSVQKTGNSAEERFAWQTMPEKEEYSFLFSPRVGRFVDDYCGLIVSGSLLCTFPFSRATPNMWSEIKLTELTAPSRKCITVGRNESGDIVGVLFVTEVAQDSAISDSVASYV